MMTKKTTHRIPAPTRTDVGLTIMAIVLRVIRFMSAPSPLVADDDELVFAGSTAEMVDGLKAAQTYTETVSEPSGKCLDGLTTESCGPPPGERDEYRLAFQGASSNAESIADSR
jgi:hypothetical protein